MSEKDLSKYRIGFKEINKENLSDICSLSNSLTDNQKKCVATNAYSIAQAHYNLDRAWFRGIYLREKDKPIGFIMVDFVADDVPGETQPSIFLWRFMIAKDYQKKGYASEALDLVADIFKAQGKQIFYTSCVEKNDESPLPFYKKYGFENTNIEEDEEIVLKKLI